MLFPFYWMVLTSLRSQVDNVSRVPVWFFTPTWENYQNVIARNNFLEFTWNSFVIAALSTGFGLVLGLPAAYSIARFKQDGLALAILIARLTPYITYLVPWYLAFRALGLIDTYLALTLTHLIVGMPLIVWIMISFFENVPQDLEEAAFVDGATRIGAFMRVILPLSTPGHRRGQHPGVHLQLEPVPVQPGALGAQHAAGAGGGVQLHLLRADRLRRPRRRGGADHPARHHPDAHHPALDRHRPDDGRREGLRRSMLAHLRKLAVGEPRLELRRSPSRRCGPATSSSTSPPPASAAPTCTSCTTSTAPSRRSRSGTRSPAPSRRSATGVEGWESASAS
jgi:ABC-type nitrate/sulfonate/bicarbonate transport system permease component